jgi:hypothetical protein
MYLLHIYEKIILTMNKVNEIVSKYAERLKSFGIKLSAEGEIEAAAPVKMAVAILKDGTEVSSPDEMIAVGSPLFVMDAEGNEIPAPDGKHETAEGKYIVTVGGVVTEILEPEMESEVVEEEQAAAFDGVSKEEFEATISALIEQFESRINSLTAEKTELSAQVEKLSKQPATNSVKKSSVSVNAAPINLAKMDSKNRIFAIINKYK